MPKTDTVIFFIRKDEKKRQISHKIVRGDSATLQYLIRKYLKNKFFI